MKSKLTKKLLLTVAVAASAAVPASNVLADDAATIFGYGTGTLVNYNGNGTTVAGPVVTEILSVPGVSINGYTYSATSGTFLAADSSGSVEIYQTPAATYTPTVGDQLNISGTYKPYSQIPEISTITGVSVLSTGNAAPSALPITTTIPQVNVVTLPQNLAGQWLQLNNVTISDTGTGDSALPSSGNYGTGDLTLTITDPSGNSMEFYYYPHDFSLANQNLFGQAIITGQPVDMLGIADVYSSSSPEFLGMQIVPTPEPTTLALCGVASVLGLVYRRRKNA
jgi:hypothetical protein